MTVDDIKHFLVIRDMAAGRTDVREFGDDYDAAQDAYAQVEWETRNRRRINVVLLSSDSLETVKRTHSSYFERRESFESLLPPGVLRVS
jgi:hypothetical protein